MSKKCFFSFHYKKDVWRVSQVREIGVIEKQPLLKSNEWEEIKKKGDDDIKDWISKNMKGKECLVVLVGKETAGRRWVKYEIKKAWKDGLGVVAICIHGLKDAEKNQSDKGSNPFDGLFVDGKPVEGKFYDPPYVTSKFVYDDIAENIESLVKDAIKARSV